MIARSNLGSSQNIKVCNNEYGYGAGNCGGTQWLSSPVSMKYKLERSLFKFDRCLKERGWWCGPKGSVVVENLTPLSGKRQGKC